MKYVIILVGIAVTGFIGCKKASEWLNEPRSSKDITFNSLKDYQDLLNNTSLFNMAIPTLGLLGTDNVYFKESSIPAMPLVERNSYLWNKDIFEGRVSVDYTSAYQSIYNANVILDGLEERKWDETELDVYNGIKGQAHFFRAFAYLELANLFCRPYNTGTAKLDLGLCLKLSSDINLIVKRSSVFDSYMQMLKDARTAASLLDSVGPVKTRPTKVAAYQLLARIYLSMSDYENAKLYSDSVLTLSNSLIDFNVVPNIQIPYRFPDFKGGNSEISFYAQGFPYSSIIPSDNINLGLVDTTLYRSYDQNDLRRHFFFSLFDSNTVKFKGSYTGNATLFCGLSICEAYYIRAECYARSGDVSFALKDLNKVLTTRYRRGTYVNFESDDPDVVLLKVIQERRKEFPYNGNLRWQDLRRFNMDPRLATTIKRKLTGSKIELKPNDPKYVYPFPQNEINITGIEQNVR